MVSRNKYYDIDFTKASLLSQHVNLCLRLYLGQNALSREQAVEEEEREAWIPPDEIMMLKEKWEDNIISFNKTRLIDT